MGMQNGQLLKDLNPISWAKHTLLPFLSLPKPPALSTSFSRTVVLDRHRLTCHVLHYCITFNNFFKFKDVFRNVSLFLQFTLYSLMFSSSKKVEYNKRIASTRLIILLF